jgi:hypothetical protein
MSELWPGLDHIANFINALDSEGMTAGEVRSAIYAECIKPRAAPLPAGDDGELCARLKRTVANNGHYKDDSRRPVNPDGPRAAARIAALNAEVARKDDEIAAAYNAGYDDGWDDGRDPDSIDPRKDSTARGDGLCNFRSAPGDRHE